MIAFTFDRLWHKEKVDLTDKKDILFAERVWDTDKGGIGNVDAQVGVDLCCNSDGLSQREGVSSPFEVSTESFSHFEWWEVEEVVILFMPTERHLGSFVLIEMWGELDNGQSRGDILSVHIDYKYNNVELSLISY